MLKELINVFRGESLLDKAFQQSYEMFDITKEMFIEGSSSLREHDSSKLKTTIYEQDQAVNRFERKVRKNVMKHLSENEKHDIYSGLVLISIVIDIERLGDYTKNIVELAENHHKKLKGGKYKTDLKKIEDTITNSFTIVKESFESGDIDSASKFLREFEWVNKLCDQHIIDYIKANDDSLTQCDAVTLALYFRYLKRLNSHLRNIASSVVNPFHKIGYYEKENY